MKKRVFIIFIGLVLFVAVATAYLFHEPSGVQIAEVDVISEVQMDAVKMNAERFGQDKLETLVKNIQAAVPENKLQAMQVLRPDSYFVIAFLGNNKELGRFYFFCTDEKFYMQTKDGDLYSGVDFIKEYLVGDFEWIPGPKGASVGMIIPEQKDIEHAMETSYDVRYWLYNQIQANKAAGMSDEVAITSAKDTILWEYKMYQYAKENNYEIPDKKYQEVVEDRIADAKAQENYADVEQVYEHAGTTLEEHIRKSSEMIWRAEDTVDYMEFCFYNEFRDGNYVVDGVTYDSAGAYSDAKRNDLILHVMDDVDVSAFGKKLDDAEVYVRQYNE